MGCGRRETLASNAVALSIFNAIDPLRTDATGCRISRKRSMMRLMLQNPSCQTQVTILLIRLFKFPGLALSAKRNPRNE